MSRIITFINNTIAQVLKQDEKRRFFAGAFNVFVLQIIGVAGAYILQALLANWMSGTDFGSYIYTYNWANLLAVFGGFGLTLSVLKFVPDYLDQAEWGRLKGVIFTFSVSVVLGSLLVGILAIIFFYLFPPQDIHQMTLLVGLLMTPLVGLSVLYMEILRGMDVIFFAYAPLRVGQHVLLIVSASIVFIVFKDLVSFQVILLWGLVLLLIVLFQTVIIFRRMPNESKQVKRVYEVKHWFRTSLPMLLIRGASVLMDRVDILMVGMLLGAVPTGIYAVASRTAGFTSFALTAVNAVTAPRISPLYNQGKMEELEQIAKRATILSLGISFIVFIVLVILSDFLLSIFGPEFRAGKQILIILGIAQLINAAVGPVGFLMHLTNHQVTSGKIYGVSVFINIGLNLIFIRGFNMGIEGAAWGTAITLVIQNLWMLSEVRKNLNINPLPIG